MTTRDQSIPALVADHRAGLLQKRTPYALLTVDDKLLALWGMYRGYSMASNSRFTNVGIDTLRKLRDTVFEDPLSIFELPVYIQQGQKKFRCNFCSGVKMTKTLMIRHVLAHIIPYEMARDIDIRQTNGRITL